MAERGYLGRDVPLLKHVAAKAGQRVCRIGANVGVDGRAVTVALIRDRNGRSLHAWQGFRKIGRASCRERVGHNVSVSVGADTLKKNKHTTIMNKRSTIDTP